MLPEVVLRHRLARLLGALTLRRHNVVVVVEDEEHQTPLHQLLDAVPVGGGEGDGAEEAQVGVANRRHVPLIEAHRPAGVDGPLRAVPLHPPREVGVDGDAKGTLVGRLLVLQPLQLVVVLHGGGVAALGGAHDEMK